MKMCSKCHTEKDESEFTKDLRLKSGLSSQCMVCRDARRGLPEAKARASKYRALPRVRAHRAEVEAEWKKMQRAWLNDIKATLSCAVCGENCPACLDFHHTDSAIKDFAVGEMVRRHQSKSSILAEMAKCVVLCSNCHRKVHTGLVTL